MVNKTNFSGNNLTGVPTHNFVSSAECDFPAEVQLYIQYNYVSAIPLNDANSVFADKYHLLQTKVSCQKKFPTYTVKFYAGADNLLNARYSLGNDLNAFGARFYNPAPPVNFYGGISLQF
jgi:iron complex outermembrane receptor protein